MVVFFLFSHLFIKAWDCISFIESIKLSIVAESDISRKGEGGATDYLRGGLLQSSFNDSLYINQIFLKKKGTLSSPKSTSEHQVGFSIELGHFRSMSTVNTQMFTFLMWRVDHLHLQMLRVIQTQVLSRPLHQKLYLQKSESKQHIKQLK